MRYTQKELVKKLKPNIYKDNGLIVKSPNESDVWNVEPYTLKEIRKILGYWTIRGMEKDLSQCTYDNKPLFQIISKGKRSKNDLLIINTELLGFKNKLPLFN